MQIFLKNQSDMAYTREPAINIDTGHENLRDFIIIIINIIII